jgi:hypothetical protein
MKRNWNFDKGYRVYYNLHTHVFSIQAWDADKKGWRLYDHQDEVQLEDVTFKVYESGRQRVLREKKKNVHAYVIAKRIVPVDHRILWWRKITYDPYKYESFVYVKDKQPVGEHKLVLLRDKKILCNSY